MPATSSSVSPAALGIPSFHDLQSLREPSLPPGSRPALGPATMFVTKGGQIVTRVRQKRGRLAQWLLGAKTTFFRFDPAKGQVVRRWIWNRHLRSEGETQSILNVVLRQRVRERLGISREVILTAREGESKVPAVDQVDFQDELIQRIQEVDERMARQIEAHVKRIPLHTKQYSDLVRHIDAKLASVEQEAVDYTKTNRIGQFYETLLSEWNADGSSSASISPSRYERTAAHFGHLRALRSTRASVSPPTSSPADLRRTAESILNLSHPERGLFVLRWIAGVPNRLRSFGVGGSAPAAADRDRAVVPASRPLRRGKPKRLPARSAAAAAATPAATTSAPGSRPSRSVTAAQEPPKTGQTSKAKPRRLRPKKHANRAWNKVRAKVSGTVGSKEPRAAEKAPPPGPKYVDMPPESNV